MLLRRSHFRKNAAEQGLTYWAYCLLSLLTVLRFLLSERLSSLGLPPACCNDIKIRFVKHTALDEGNAYMVLEPMPHVLQS